MTLGHNVNIDFSFVKVQITNKNLQYKYKKGFAASLNDTSYELKMRKSDLATS
jgi:hypothetical protein